MNLRWLGLILVMTLVSESVLAGGILPSWMRRDKNKSDPTPEPEVIIQKADPVVLRPPVITDLSVELDPSGRELVVSGRVQDDKRLEAISINGDQIRLRHSEFVYRASPSDGNNQFVVRAEDSDGLVSEGSVSFYVAGTPRDSVEQQQVSDDATSGHRNCRGQ